MAVSLHDRKRVEQLLRGPVLRTLGGCRQRIKCLPLADQMRLCSHFDCDVDNLHRRLWQPKPIRRIEPDGPKSETRHPQHQ